MSIINPQPQKLPGPSLLHRLVRDDVDDNTPALDYQDEYGERNSTSYRTLHDKSDHLAKHLHDARERSGASQTQHFIVPVFIGQCPELYISQLAILKAGGAFCPITLDVPEDRLRFILKDASATVLVTTSELKARLPVFEDVTVVAVDDVLRSPFCHRPAVEIKPTMPAYVMYTSGSTGQPKGVLLSHSAATQALLAHDRHIPTFSRFLQFASPTFDVSVFEIFFPLFRGCTLVVCERKRMLNDLPATINALDVDGAELTPSVANSLLQGRQSVPNLKVLLTIGEMLKQSVVEDFGGSPEEDAVLHGMYGPTEATIHCTLQPNFGKDMAVNNIGVPLDTVSAFVIRPASADHPSHMVEILPIGEEGELAVGGYQLADGYLNREEQTKATFVSHPEYGQLYRTGDRAKVDPQNRLMCLGRISSGQVKLRGQRIELGEIEYAASRTPGCRDVVADVISDTLVVFCVSSAIDLHEQNIVDTCKKWLPPYMVPTDVLIMESMPYLASGKVDRRTLQGLHQEFREAQELSAGAELDNETQELAQALSEALGFNALDFPTLSAVGIDSLTSIRIASLLRKRGYPHVNATDILEARSLSELRTKLVEQQTIKQADATEVSLLGDDAVRSLLESHQYLSSHMEKIQDIVRCTPVQSAMLSETTKDLNAYCNWIELQVDVQRSMAEVEEAVRALTHHHEMLRTGFAALNHAQHPYVSVIWKQNACLTTQVTELERDFAIKDEAQLLRPRPIQLCRSMNGINILLQLHHSLYDQWSIDVIKQDLDHLLQENNLPPRPSYSVVSAFHAQHNSQTTSEIETEYWQTHLMDTAVTPLPQLNPKKCSPDLRRSSWVPIDISTAFLKEKATQMNTSAPAIFQAAYAYLLSMYVGASDVMYGSVLSGRHIPVAGIERIVGPCLATLPSRVDIGGMRSAQDLVRAVHNQNRSMIKHSATSLAVVKKIGKYAPNEAMFDTLFVWQESTFASPLLVTEIDSADKHELNMVVEVEPRGDSLAVRVTYRQNRMCSEQVDMFTSQLQCIAKLLIDEPQSSLVDVSNRLPNHVMAIDNPYPTSHPHGKGLIAVLEEVAERTPSAPALVFGQRLAEPTMRFQSLSFSDMHTKANKVARYLVSQGVESDDLVCVCMEKSVDLYVTILAVLKAGAGYLPLLPDTPKDRLISILDQTSPKLLLCDSNAQKDVRSATRINMVELSTVDLADQSSTNLKLPYNGSHAAYSIFTSGSTGTPKGLVVTQDNLLGNLSTLANIYPVSAGDRLLQACSQAFDVSVFEIFFAFFTGMPLCFARKDDLFQDIEHAIRALQITHLSLTPTVAALVDPKNVPSVRFLVTAGEAMTDVVHRKWADNGLHQGYGPSETTNICTVNPQMPSSDIISNIGPAFPNTSAFVIDPSKPFRILPFGAVGEFAFGGEQVFRGYIGRDELNAEKIISHPQYGRVYRSGDIGRMLPNGSMLISGRLDDQVKVRGNRIELGEVNASILSQDGVKDCTAMVFGKDAVTQSIAAFWIAANNSTHDFEIVQPTERLKQQVGSLYKKLEDSLPPYMIPTAMIPVTTLPRTTQGKLDRRQLEQAASGMSEDEKRAYFRSAGQTEDNEDEWTSTERDLAAALQHVLDIPSDGIGRSTSFFALGLNSVNAIAYAKALERVFATIVSVGAILRNASIARLARSLASESKQPNDTSAANLTEVFSQATIDAINEKLEAHSSNVEAILPCTPLQEAMLSAGDSEGDASYFNRTTFRINGDASKLTQSFLTLVKRHAILRTSFYEISDPNHPFAQVVFKEIDMPWLKDSASLAAKDCNGEGGPIPLVSHVKPFFMTTEVMENSTLLTLNMHHAIYDGMSMEILLEEAEKLYYDIELLPASAFQPFLREVASHTRPGALNFWSSCVKDFYAKPFPLRSELDGSVSGGRVRLPLETTSADINSFSKRHNVSATSIFQAAWTKVLMTAQSADDVCFGDVVSGRSVPVADVDRLVAPCFNTLPVRVSLDENCDNVGLVRKLHRQRLATEPYQLSPLRRIQAQSKNPDVHLFDSLLLVQPPTRELSKDIWEMREDEGLMDLPLVIEVVQGSKQSELIVHFSGKYLSQDDADALATFYVKSLEDCVRYPSSNFRGMLAAGGQPEGMLETQFVPQVASSNNDDGTSAETWTQPEQLVRQAFSHFGNVAVSKIRRQTSLYKLGLDSLNAVQIASRIRSQGIAVTAADVLEHRTPAALAAAACTEPAAGRSDDASKPDFARYDSDHRFKIIQSLQISSSSLESVRPCTPAQNGMISQSLQTKGALYVNHITYKVPRDISAENIRSAWQEVQRKHQALRMGFVETEEASCPFAMLIYRDGEVAFPFQFGTSSDNDSSAAIVEKLHLPAWRVTVNCTSSSHEMTLSIHHALYDAESLQLLLRDFGLATQHKEIGSSASIDNLLRPMIMGANPRNVKAEEFWRNALTHTSPATFPNLHPTISFASDLYSVETSSSLSYPTLEGLCKTQGCTIQAAGQGAWAMLLSAYLGEAGVTFGTVFSGRAGSQQDNVVFPSLTTVPVFCDTSKGASHILNNMTNFNGAAQRYRYVPLSNIQRFANLPGQALFDTVFVYQKPTGSVSDNLSWALVKQSAAVDYNVSIELEATQTGRMSLRLTANRGIVPEEHASLLLSQYDHLLSEILHGDSPSSQPISELYSVTPPICPSLPSPVQLLHQFVEEGARNYPDKPALEFAWNMNSSPRSRKVWSYQQLDERANQLARSLNANGAMPGDIVAVCMDKCPEASFAFVGILKAGCAFLALDPELPLARKQFILQDSGAAVLLVDEGRGVCDDNSTVKILKLSTDELDAFPNSGVDVPDIDPQATCYCLYTSGTTGTPKGCELTHENAVQAMMAFQKLFAGRWDDKSRWLQFASYWFDVSVLEQFWSWSVGITMVGAPRDLVLDDITLFIQQMRITHIDLTPSLARIVEPEDVPSLWDGVFITGGEALKQEIIEKWGIHKTICNGYGPTEATIGVTMNPFIGADAKASNIGPAFLNVGSYIFEPGTTTPVLRGAVGELCVSGKLVGKGYLNRPELTAKAFQVLEDTGEKIYRTGDLVRQVADGSFLFIGRQDSQAKLRGQRLEIDEIDSVIKSSSNDIADYASLVIKSGDKETLVTFFITEVRKQTPDLLLEISEKARTATQTAFESCRAHLPGYMVPTHILPVNIIPLTVNNKIDAKRLNAFYNGLSVSDLQKVTSTHTEKKPLAADAKRICKILERMLSVDISQIDNSTNIFSLGLSSVSAITFATLLKRSGFLGANVALIMRNPAIEQLANALITSADASQNEDFVRQAQMNMAAFDRRHRVLAASKLGVSFDNVEVVAPCTPLQQGLIVESIKGEQHPYFNHFRFVADHLDIPRLQRAFQQITNQVQALRTKFMQTDDGYAQIVLHHQDVPWHHVQHTLRDEAEEITKQRTQWLERNGSDLTNPFEISLIRFKTTSLVVVHIHHALYDGVSFDMVMDRVSRAYNEESVDCGPNFTDAIPHGPLCTVKDADVFWEDHLGPSTSGRLPPITDAVAEVDPVETLALSGGMNLDAACRKLGVSHQAVTQACFSVVLNEFAPSVNTYGVVVSGRSFSFDGADQVLGPLFNTIPNPSGLRADDTWTSLIQRCQASSAATLPYQHTPLRDIKKWCRFVPSDPVFDVLFVFQNLGTNETSATSTIWKPLSDEPKAEYPLAFELERNAGGELTATAVAKRNYATGAGLRKILQSFDRALRLLGQDPEKPIVQDFQISPASTIAKPSETEPARNLSYLNGVHDFSWTTKAQKLRSEIANIASLENDDIDEHSTIFSLGLDSIDAVKLASRLKKSAMSISVSKLLKAQTIPRILACINGDVESNATKESTSLFKHMVEQLSTGVSLSGSVNRAQIERIIPATPSQEALVAEMVRSNFLEYYNHDVLQLKPDVSFEKLRQAWTSVVQSSSILRTSFVEVSSPDIDAVYAQIVHKFNGLDFAHIKLDDSSDLKGVLDDVREDVKRSYSVSPPTRLTLVEVGMERYLVLSLAHAQYDGHSLALIHRDVERAYSDVPVADRPFPDEVIQGSLIAVDGEALAFWRNNLSGAQISRMPRANPRGRPSTLHRVEKTSSIFAQEARSYCQKSGVSMQSLAQSSWALTLAHYARRLEVVFGAVLACRDSEEAEQILFPMMNTVAIRAVLHGSRKEMLKHMQDINTDVLTHQRTPLRHIQRVAADVVNFDDLNEGNNDNSLFDTLFVYQHRPEQDDQQVESLYDSVGGSSNIEYPVAVEVEAVGERLILRAACKDNVLDYNGAHNLLRTLDQALQGMVYAPEKSTVAFRGSQVSICDLPLTDFETINTARTLRDEEDTNEDEASDVSIEAATIRDALCQVSRTPPGELSPSSTIESIGIDSISAIKVVAILRKQGVKLTVGELIRAKTVGRMARVVQDRVADSATDPTYNAKETVARYIEEHRLGEVPALHELDVRNIQSVLPALPGQIYMLNVWQATQGQLFYPTFTYRFTSHASVEQLQSAWQALVSKHEILRTIFCATNNIHNPMCQVVLRQAPDSFSSGESQPQSSLQQPMARLRLVQTTPSWILKLTIHHALYDAISLPLLMEDLATFVAGSLPAPSPASQAEFMALSLAPAAQISRKQFWTTYFKNTKPLGLKQPSREDVKSRVEIFKPSFLSATNTLETVARKASLTPQSILFAAHAKAFAKIAGKSQQDNGVGGDVVIGIYLSNRSHIEHLSSLRSPTLNLVPLLVRAAGSTPLLDSAKEIQHDLQSIGSPENSAVGLWEIAEWTGIRVDTFVNFLRLPNTIERESEDGKGELLAVEDERLAARSHIIDNKIHADFCLPIELSSPQQDTRNAYMHSLDLEATITPGGTLDVGVFCPTAMVDLPEAEALLQDLRMELENVCV